MLQALLNKFSPKYGIEILSKSIIDHVGHAVNRYDMLIDFSTGIMTIVIQHPGPNIPPTYMPPVNGQLKNRLLTNIPLGSRVYDMNIKSGVDTIKNFIGSQLPGVTGNIDFIKLFVDRDKKEIPCEIYYTTKENEKVKLKHTIK